MRSRQGRYFPFQAYIVPMLLKQYYMYSVRSYKI